jgi:hypothetical protein
MQAGLVSRKGLAEDLGLHPHKLCGNLFPSGSSAAAVLNKQVAETGHSLFKTLINTVSLSYSYTRIAQV